MKEFTAIGDEAIDNSGIKEALDTFLAQLCETFGDVVIEGIEYRLEMGEPHIVINYED